MAGGANNSARSFFVETYIVGYESPRLKAVQTYLRKTCPAGSWQISSSPKPNSLICDEALAKKLLAKDFGILTIAGSQLQNNIVIGLRPEHMFTLPYGRFLFKTFGNRVLRNSPQIYLDWVLVQSTSQAEEALQELQNAKFISCDIETGHKSRLQCIGFSTTKKAYVFPCSQSGALAFYDHVKAILKSEVPKCFHNGMFDMQHLIAHGFEVSSYYLDTLGLMHAFCAELPKTLASTALLFVDGLAYWKDESESNLYEYNAKDCMATALACERMLSANIPWIKSNYLIQFPYSFPVLEMNLRGLRVDKAKLEEFTNKAVLDSHEHGKYLWKLFGNRFNPKSPKHVQVIMEKLSRSSVESSDTAARREWALENPLFSEIEHHITGFRESEKIISSYYRAKLKGDRMLFSINPFGTETGRFSASKSSFYEDGIDDAFGLNIQTIPPEMKPVFTPSKDGWKLYEMDKSASESYCTAMLSKEEKLSEALRVAPDFHLWNASMFFGIPFEELWLDGKGKKVNQALRDLAKRINHGANYNMSPPMLALTMGSEKIFAARKLLNLPENWGVYKIAEYLLKCFEKAYPRIRGEWQKEIVAEVGRTNRIANPISGWVRLTFKNPASDKTALNALVAHGPQHLSVKLVNDGMLAIYKELVLAGKEINLLVQTHDSLLFETPHHELALEAQAIFNRTGNGIPSTLTGPLDYWRKE